MFIHNTNTTYSYIGKKSGFEYFILWRFIANVPKYNCLSWVAVYSHSIMYTTGVDSNRRRSRACVVPLSHNIILGEWVCFIREKYVFALFVFSRVTTIQKYNNYFDYEEIFRKNTFYLLLYAVPSFTSVRVT